MAQPAWTNWNRVKKELIDMWQLKNHLICLPTQSLTK
jgi:hypothetical protein